MEKQVHELEEQKARLEAKVAIAEKAHKTQELELAAKRLQVVSLMRELQDCVDLRSGKIYDNYLSINQIKKNKPSR